jgi:hypothetical protein
MKDFHFSVLAAHDCQYTNYSLHEKEASDWQLKNYFMTFTTLLIISDIIF